MSEYPNEVEIFCYDHNKIIDRDDYRWEELHAHCKEHPFSKMQEIHEKYGKGYPYRRIK